MQIPSVQIKRYCIASISDVYLRLSYTFCQKSNVLDARNYIIKIRTKNINCYRNQVSCNLFFFGQSYKILVRVSPQKHLKSTITTKFQYCILTARSICAFDIMSVVAVSFQIIIKVAQLASGLLKQA